MSGYATEGQLERERVQQRLERQLGAGDLTLAEYDERTAAVGAASTVQELETAAGGLAEEAEAEPPKQHGRWHVAILGGSEQRGRWRLARRLRVVALLGGVKLDLGNAEVEARESRITVVAMFGGAELLAPPGIPFQLSGFSIFGGRSDERTGGPALRGAPLVHVRAFAFFGGVAVKDRAPRRDLLELVRARLAEPSGGSPAEGD
jgi:hypothetical protein